MKASNLSESDIESVVAEVFTNHQFCCVESAYQQLAKTMCSYFTEDGQSDFILSRVYHSFNFSLLPASLQNVAQEIWGTNNENAKFIVLLGTYGVEPAWQDRRQSKGHKTILLNHDTLKNIPMVSRLLQQIGINLGSAAREDQGIEFEGISGTFGVFYVSPAKDSPYIPAQDFVTNYNVHTVVGTGVMLPQGDIAAYIGFSRTPIDKEVASNIAPLMSLFWQKAVNILEDKGMFCE